MVVVASSSHRAENRNATSVWNERAKGLKEREGEDAGKGVGGNAKGNAEIERSEKGSSFSDARRDALPREQEHEERTTRHCVIQSERHYTRVVREHDCASSFNWLE